MTTCRGSSIFFVVAVLLACSPGWATEAKLSYHVTPEAIQPGERATLELRLPVEGLGNLEEHPPVVRDELLTKSEALKILDQDYRRDGKELVWRYQLTAYQNGEVSVPPIEIQVGSQSFSSESTRLHISPTRREKDDGMRDDYDEVKVPFRWTRVLVIASLLSLIIAGGVGVAIYLRRRKKLPEPEPIAPTAPEEDPLQWLRRHLAQVREKVTLGSEYDAAIDELSHVVRQFFERASRNPVETWTTTEFRSNFARDPVAQEVSRILARCDEARFSNMKSLSPRETAVSALDEMEHLLLP